MPAKKGLGRDVTNSMETMESLMQCLKDFHDMRLKDGLASNGLLDEKISKVINDAKETAASLRGKIEDIRGQVKALKPKRPGISRFAGQRIVSKFLELS